MTYKRTTVSRLNFHELCIFIVVIAECTVPSIGVGFELGVAYKLGLPTLALFRQNPNVIGLFSSADPLH